MVIERSLTRAGRNAGHRPANMLKTLQHPVPGGFQSWGWREKAGWGGRIRTSEWRNQNQMTPYYMSSPVLNILRLFTH
jgi:hypothetical protein